MKSEINHCVNGESKEESKEEWRGATGVRKRENHKIDATKRKKERHLIITGKRVVTVKREKELMMGGGERGCLPSKKKKQR